MPRDRSTRNFALEVEAEIVKNLPHYPHDVEITAIDFSLQMLKWVHRKAMQLDLEVEFLNIGYHNKKFLS